MTTIQEKKKLGLFLLNEATEKGVLSKKATEVFSRKLNTKGIHGKTLDMINNSLTYSAILGQKKMTFFKAKREKIAKIEERKIF